MVQTRRRTLLVTTFIVLIVLIVVVVRFYPSSTSDAHEPFVISSDSEFTAANGVVSGSGTEEDPYVIEGWKIAVEVVDEYPNLPIGIHVLDTTAHFIIRDLEIISGTSHGGVSIYLMRTMNGQVENCIMDGGIRGYFCTDIRISECQAESVGFYYSSGTQVTSSAIDGTIQFSHSNQTRIMSNDIAKGGIDLYGDREVDVESNTITGEDAGIYLSSCYDCNITDNSMIDDGIEITGNKLHQFDSHTISETNFVSGKKILSYRNAEKVEITGSDFWQLIAFDCGSVSMVAASTDGARSAVIITSTSSVEIDDCVFADGKDGVVLIECSDVSLTDSSIHSYFHEGVIMIYCNDGSIIGNSIYSNGGYVYGGYLEEGWVTPENYGLALVSSSDFEIYHNTFLANSYAAYDNNPGANSWNQEYGIGGNYWGGGTDVYAGPAQDIPSPDGVVDSPYKLPGCEYPEFAMDRYPSTTPYAQISLPSEDDEGDASEGGVTDETVCLASIPVAFVIIVLFYVMSKRKKDSGGEGLP